MIIRLNQIRVPLDYTPENVKKQVLRALRVPGDRVQVVEIVRRSVDARSRHSPPVYVTTIEVTVTGTCSVPKGAEVVPPPPPTVTKPVQVRHPEHRPLVVGAGPAGLMATLTLAEAGLEPLLIERGAPAQERDAHVDQFVRDGTLDPESNVLYGEGGAGLYSDGKLTARSKDRQRIKRFLDVLVECGASSDILIDAAPHIGSDALLNIVPSLRRRIIACGGEVRFHSALQNVHAEQGTLRSATVNGQELPLTSCLLATGHSARDVYRMLSTVDAATLAAKPFALGLRVELPQAKVDRAQWGPWAGDSRLGAATLRLTRRAEGDTRACYTFCPCPGGLVIPCAASPGELTTNGMSLSKRDLPFFNAAFLVPVTPQDFAPDATGALAGVRFQEDIEKAAFRAGGADYSVPASRLADFLQGTAPTSLPQARSLKRSAAVDLRAVLPEFVAQTLTTCIPAMLRELHGMQIGDVLLYAPETRSSSPVRIARLDDGQSESIRGLYPCGEGSGYAGGIVSSAIDGMKAAESMMARLADRSHGRSGSTLKS